MARVRGLDGLAPLDWRRPLVLVRDPCGTAHFSVRLDSLSWSPRLHALVVLRHELHPSCRPTPDPKRPLPLPRTAFRDHLGRALAKSEVKSRLLARPLGDLLPGRPISHSRLTRRQGGFPRGARATLRSACAPRRRARSPRSGLAAVRLARVLARAGHATPLLRNRLDARRRGTRIFHAVGTGRQWVWIDGVLDLRVARQGLALHAIRVLPRPITFIPGGLLTVVSPQSPAIVQGEPLGATRLRTGQGEQDHGERGAGAHSAWV